MKEKKLLPLFLSQSLRSVAVSLLGFFSAIYIYKQTLSLLTVVAFYLLLYIFKIIASHLAENWALKFGLKKQIFLGLALTGLALLAFYGSAGPLAGGFLFIWPAAILWGLAIGFFWFGRFGLLLKISQLGHFGRAVGWSGIVDTILLLGVPFLGGMLIGQFGYPILFLVAFGFVILAFLVVLPLEEQKTHQDVEFKDVLKLFLTHKRMALAYFASGARGLLYSTALILYIFLVLKKEMALGGFFSLSMLLVALANFLTGHWVDKKGKKDLVTYGSIVSSLVWLGRFLVISVGGLFILDVIDRVSSGMLGIPFEVLTYEKAIDGRSTGRALLFRELAITAGSIFACLLLALIIWLGLELKFAFLIAMVFNLLPLLTVKNIALSDGDDH